MRTSAMIGIVIGIAIILGGAYIVFGMKTSAPVQGGTSTVTTSTTTTTTVTATSTSETPVLSLATSPTLGQYLVAVNGMALYTSSADTAGVSNCSGSCATSWPPYTIPPDTTYPVAVGVSGMVGVISRADGSLQVTYNGMPLYYWTGDTTPGNTTGNGVGTFVLAHP